MAHRQRCPRVQWSERNAPSVRIDAVNAAMLARASEKVGTITGVSVWQDAVCEPVNGHLIGIESSCIDELSGD